MVDNGAHQEISYHCRGDQGQQVEHTWRFLTNRFLMESTAGKIPSVGLNDQ